MLDKNYKLAEMIFLEQVSKRNKEQKRHHLFLGSEICALVRKRKGRDCLFLGEEFFP